MSVPTLHTPAPQPSPPTSQGLRFRLKQGPRPSGSVQGGWWPRTTRLANELPGLLAELESRLGRVERVVYDENVWTPTPLRMVVRGHSVILEGSRDEPNTVSVSGRQFGTRVLVVIPPHFEPGRAYTAVMTAADPGDQATPDELLGIDAREAEDRRLALRAQQRWETEGGALRNPRREADEIAVEQPYPAQRKLARIPRPAAAPNGATPSRVAPQKVG